MGAGPGDARTGLDIMIRIPIHALRSPFDLKGIIGRDRLSDLRLTS
jgi:hypothetical protein